MIMNTGLINTQAPVPQLDPSARGVELGGGDSHRRGAALHTQIQGGALGQMAAGEGELPAIDQHGRIRKPHGGLGESGHASGTDLDETPIVRGRAGARPVIISVASHAIVFDGGEEDPVGGRAVGIERAVNDQAARSLELHDDAGVKRERAAR